MTTACSLHMEIPADVSAPGRAREAVRTRLDGLLSKPAMEDLVLMVSEMVTMVLRSATEPSMNVWVAWRTSSIRAEVSDGPTEISPGIQGQVLDFVSARWGIDSKAPSVWAEMAKA